MIGRFPIKCSTHLQNSSGKWIKQYTKYAENKKEYCCESSVARAQYHIWQKVNFQNDRLRCRRIIDDYKMRIFLYQTWWEIVLFIITQSQLLFPEITLRFSSV